MKKFLIAAAIALFCYAPVVDAAFYDDTSMYVQVSKTAEYASYHDALYVESVRYDPPFYVLKGRLVTIGYSHGNMITYNTYKIFYNINTRTAEWQMVEARFADEDGNITQAVDFEKEGLDMSLEPVKIGTPVWFMAEGIFYRYYGVHFFKEFLKYN